MSSVSSVVRTLSLCVTEFGMNRDPWKFDVLRLALLMGLGSVIGVYLILTTTLITKDGVFYIEQAQQIAQDPAGVCRRHPPGYPFLIWAGHAIASRFAEGDSPRLWAYSAQAVTLLCRVLTLIPLYLLGRLLVGSVNSFWALFALLILPYPAFYGSDVLREWPYLLLLSTGLLVLYWGLSSGRGWTLGLVGLDAALGYLIRPECAQLVLYAVLGLIAARNFPPTEERTLRPTLPLGAGLLTIFGFVVPIAPYVYASGGIVPHQFRPMPVNLPPILSQIGPQAASDDPLEFEVRAGESLELAIRVTDPDDDPLTFCLAGIPAGSSPVYLFRNKATGAQFWTLWSREKDRLLTVYPQLWHYEGVGWYAYASPDVRAGLLPVYRFWSPSQERHFYTIRESQSEEVLAKSTCDTWIFEGAAFYAFGRCDPPQDTQAVYRISDPPSGYFWTITPSPAPQGEVAWHAHVAQEAPAGAGIENAVFRWRPTLEQVGEHRLNIIITDGESPCCQVVVIRVLPPGAAGPSRESSRVPQIAGLAGQDIPLRRLAAGAAEFAGGISENLMILAVVPWILGLGVHLRTRATGIERVLILAVLAVGAGLMLGRNFWLAPGSARRYTLPLVVLTIFYLPTGLDVVVLALHRVHAFGGKGMGWGVERRSLWFYLLLLGGVVLCAPKLIRTPLRADKAGYRSVARWLCENTPENAVIADPDRRIAFYANRQAILYEQYPDWKRADFVVLISGPADVQTPKGWERVYSVAVGPQEARELIVYARLPAWQ